MPFEVLDGTPSRLLWPALRRGLACKCPACGKGKLFRAYLKINDACPNCGEDLHHHRADDLPPYLAIVIVGHLLIGLMIHLDMAWHISPMTYLLVLLPVGIVMPLVLLPLIKGGVVALQWALRMHGFGDGPDPAAPDLAPEPAE